MAQAWSWPKIKWKLAEAGTSLAGLAKANGYQRASFSKMKVNASPPIQQIIADAIGVAPKLIWPSRYHRDGRPKGAQRRRPIKHNSSPPNVAKSNFTTVDTPESRLKREAA